jgi:excisionase family DNA binding protein
MIKRHRLISVKEAALIAGYTTQAIRKAIKENRLDAFKIGSQYVLEPNDVARYAYDYSKEVLVKVKKGK